MRLGKELAKQAKVKGICEEWFDTLKDTEDMGKLIAMYLKGIDFCLSNNWPDNEFIRNRFKGKMELYGVHLDENLDVKNKRVTVALGRCTGMVEVENYTVAQLYVKHDSALWVKASENSFMMIDVFDNSIISVFASGEAKVCINRFGGQVETHQTGNAVIKVIEKNKKTY